MIRNKLREIKFTAQYEWSKQKEEILLWLAWKIPRRLVYWCSIRLMANATQGKYSDTVVPDLTAMDALNRWDSESSNG